MIPNLKAIIDQAIRDNPKKPPRSKETFAICRSCIRKLETKYDFTIWWWAKTKCIECGITGHELYKQGQGLVAASKDAILKNKGENEQ